MYFEYTTVACYVPDVPVWQKLANIVMAGLVFWTSPQSLENHFIGRGNETELKSFRRAVRLRYIKISRAIRRRWVEYVNVRSSRSADASAIV